jgi:hypothetical protein
MDSTSPLPTLMIMRRIAVFLLLVIGVNGCSVAQNGITGITLDAAGKLAVTMSWCGAQPDVAILYISKDGPGTPPTEGRFVALRITGETTSFRLDAPNNDWTAEQQPGELKPGLTYAVYGASYENTHSTRAVLVTLAVAGRLAASPGMVFTGQDTSADLVTPEQFALEAREYCR